MKNTHKKITLIDPAKWHIKFTDKRKHYYQFHSSWWGTSDYLELNSDQKVIFSWLLSQFLAVNKGEISVCLEFIKGILRLELDVIKDAIRVLKDNNFIDLDSTVRKSNKPQLIEKNIIEEKRREENEIKISASELFYNEIVAKWNLGAEKFDVPKVNVLSDDRRKKLSKSCKIYKDIESWRKIFSVAVHKGFTKVGSEPFVPNWDYVFRNDNYIKFYEEYEVMFSKKDATAESIAEGDAFMKSFISE
tara:strand:- start:1112 stop:1852 length:741 start_codon:yes stop_codon:yes gene_type:complete